MEEDRLEDDLTRTDIRGWKSVARDREKYMIVAKYALTLLGLQRNLCMYETEDCGIETTPIISYHLCCCDTAD